MKRFFFSLNALLPDTDLLGSIAAYGQANPAVQAAVLASPSDRYPMSMDLLEKINSLCTVPVEQASRAVADTPLSYHLLAFLRAHPDECTLLTHLPMPWLQGLMARHKLQGVLLGTPAGTLPDGTLAKLQRLPGYREITGEAKPFAVIGRANDDAEFIGAAEVGIGYGLGRPISPAVVENASHLAYTESALFRLLDALALPPEAETPGQTIVISCAGAGTRLGLGVTKALIELDGKPLIIRQLEMLAQEEDIRIVVGFQAKAVIDMALSYRRDVLFVVNHRYMETGTGGSFSLAKRFSRRLVVSLDGDLLVHPEDMAAFLATKDTFLCGVEISTDEPMRLSTIEEGGALYATAFSYTAGAWEWSGLVKAETAKIPYGDRHVCDLLTPLLPMPMRIIRAKEVDTLSDYTRALAWVRNGYMDDTKQE